MRKNSDFLRDDIVRIIQKKLNGAELTATEQLNLANWLGENEGNRKFLNELLVPEKLAASLLQYAQVDTQNQLKRFKLKLTKETQLERLHRIIASVAAMIILGAGITLWMTNFRNADPEVGKEEHLTEDVLPGYNQAILMLSNGEEITLDTSKAGLVVRQGDLSYTDGVLVNSNKAAHAVLKTPRGGQYQLTLSDGTKVWLNADSEIHYPIEFGSSFREVKLIGEAYFEVTKNTGRPFVIFTEKQSVKVLGTEFSVKAYGHNEYTTLVEGKVEVNDSFNGKEYVLEPGYQVVFNGEQSSVRPVSIDDYTGWKDGKIIGTAVLLSSLLPEIERWYDIRFSFSEKDIHKERGYVHINRDEPLSSVLDALALTYDVKFKIQGKEVYIGQ